MGSFFFCKESLQYINNIINPYFLMPDNSYTSVILCLLSFIIFHLNFEKLL